MTSDTSISSPRLFGEISQLLTRGWGHDEILIAIAKIALRYLDGWCVVDLREESGAMRRLAIVHSDDARQAVARELARVWVPAFDDPYGLPAVLDGADTLLVRDVDDAQLARMVRTPDAEDAARALGIGSFMTVPLVVQEKVFGALTFVRDTSQSAFAENDIALAEYLATIGALAVDNFRLHRASIEVAKAEAVHQAKSDFLATMSHEIRTPINAIIGYTQLLELGLAGPASPAQQEFLARIRLSGTHLVGLVSEVLDLAKADAGKLSIAQHTGMTGVVVAAALSLVVPDAHEKGVRLIDEPASDPAGVPYLGDEQRVRQVLVNLLANAVKFTPRGGTVTVACGTVATAVLRPDLESDGPWSFIRVTDTGPGIPPQKQSAVFEPFVQASTGLTRQAGGTGLGLTISRRLARLMGGELTLESEPGRGATFTLWLPNPAAWTTGAAASQRDVDIAREIRRSDGLRPYGLAEIGLHVRGSVDSILESIGRRLRDGTAFAGAEKMRRSEIDDHQLAFLADIIQSLIVLDETGGVDSELYRDGSEIQRVVAGLHGKLRKQQGWSSAQMELEFGILGEEIEAQIRQRVPEGIGDIETALTVVQHLVDVGKHVSMSAYRSSGREPSTATPSRQ